MTKEHQLVLYIEGTEAGPPETHELRNRLYCVYDPTKRRYMVIGQRVDVLSGEERIVEYVPFRLSFENETPLCDFIAFFFREHLCEFGMYTYIGIPTNSAEWTLEYMESERYPMCFVGVWKTYSRFILKDEDADRLPGLVRMLLC